MDDGSSIRSLSFSGCDDYTTFILHCNCEEGDAEDFKQKVLHAKYNLKKRSFYSGYTLLQVAARHNRLDIFQSLFGCYETNYYGIAYVATISGQGLIVLESLRYVEGLNWKVIHYIVTTYEPKDHHDFHGSVFLASFGNSQKDFKTVLKLAGHDDVVSNHMGHTPLHLACLVGNFDMIKCIFRILPCLLLYTHKAHKDHQGNSPLHLACLNGDLNVVNYIHIKMIQVFHTSSTSQLKAVNRNGHNPLHIACQYGNIDVVKFLIDLMKLRAYNYNDKRSGDTLLHHSINKMGDIKVIKYLVNVIHCDPWHPNFKKSTPIHKACRYGYFEVLKYLISFTYHYKTSCVNNKGRTPLHEACIHGHTDIVKHLTQENHLMKKDIHCSDCHGFTPLHLACKYGQLDIIIHLLCEHKYEKALCANSQALFQPDILLYRDSHNNTPLHLAAIHNQASVIEYFCENNFLDCDIKGEKGRSLLFLAVFYQINEALDYLFNASTMHNIQIADDEGETILPMAYELKRKDLTDAIVSTSSLDIKAKTCEIEIFLFCALEGYFKAFEKILKFVVYKTKLTTTSVLLNHVDTFGNTVMHLAVNFGCVSVIHYLLHELDFNLSICNFSKESCVDCILKQSLDSVAVYFKENWENWYKHINSSDITDSNRHKEEQEFFKMFSVYKPSGINPDGYTPLHIACQRGDLKIVEYLSANKCFFLADPNGYFLLHTACIHGHLNINKEGLIAEEKNGNTPLLIACQFGHLEIVKFMLTFENTSFILNRALHVAAYFNQVSIMRYLLENNLGDINFKDETGRTPFILASMYQSWGILKFLICEYCKCERSIIDDTGKTALCYIYDNDNKDIINLYAHSLQHEFKGISYKTRALLCAAAEAGQLTAFKHICESRMSGSGMTLKHILLHETDQWGNNSLHVACTLGRFKVVQYIVSELEFDPHITNKHNQTGLHFAIQNGHITIVEFLMNFITVQSLTDKSHLNLALKAWQYGQLSIVKYFAAQVVNEPEFLQLACQNGPLDFVQLLIEDPLFNDFHYACAGGHSDNVKLLDNNIYLDSVDKNGYTPLHYATLSGSLDVVQYLVSLNPSLLKSTGHDNNTPLHLAIKSKSTSILRYFFDNEFYDGNLRGECGRTPLILAAFYQCFDTLKYLISDYSKCDHSIRDDDNKIALYYVYNTDNKDIINFYVHSFHPEFKRLPFKRSALLCAAAEKGQLTAFQYICECRSTALGIEIQQMLLQETDRVGNTALHLACSFGHLEVVQYLQNEIQFDLSILNLDGQTCFHLAIINDQHDIIQFLSSVNANDFYRDKSGSTPIHIATQYGQQNIVEMISEAHSANVLDDKGRNPLHIASSNGNLKLVQYFIYNLGFNSSCRDNQGLTPLHHACVCGSLDIVKYLDTDSIPDFDNAGYSPLHYASKHGHLLIVQHFFSKNKSQLFYMDHSNMTPLHDSNTPLHIAISHNQIEVVQYFIDQNMEDCNLKGENGKTPLQIALTYNHNKIVDYLIHCQPNYDPFIEDSSGRSTFLYLFQSHRFNIVKNILRHFGNNISCSNYESEVFLFTAATNKMVHSFKNLLQYLSRGKVMDKKQIINQYKDDSGNTAAHVASKFGCLETLQYILEEIKFSPKAKNLKDQSCLHLASVNGELSVVRYLTKSRQCYMYERDENDFDPIDLAAIHGQLAIVEYFIDVLKVSTDKSDKLGNTPLHLASKHGHKEIVQYFVEKSNNIVIYNNDRDTPLHLACHNGQYEVFKTLLTTAKYDIHAKNYQGKSISDYAQENADMAATIREVYGIEATFIPKIFFIGFSGAGKSTLVSALQKESSWLGRYRNVSNVQLCTVGVTPVRFRSARYGTVNFYDFAGHEEYHANHQLLFQSSYLPIVVLLLNLTCQEEDIIYSIKYWINILRNSLSSDIKGGVSVLLLGSHYDKIKGNKERKIHYLEVKMEEILSELDDDNIRCKNSLICLDCRKPSSDGLERVRKELNLSCLSSKLKMAQQFSYKKSLICQKIFIFLTQTMSSKIACTVSDICNLAKKETVIPDVVENDEEMFQICRTLSFYGKIVLFTDFNQQDESWVIMNVNFILSEFHKSMQRLQIKEGKSSLNQMACGLVSLSKLQQTFADNFDVLIKYLKYSQICSEVDPKSFSVIPQSLVQNKYLFFPYLMKESKPELFKLHSVDDMTPFYCWKLVCEEPLTPRFLQVLLIQLTFPIPGAGDIVPPVFTVWKNGIHIKNNDTTESIIEVTNPPCQLILSLRCKNGRESCLLKRRSQLVHHILAILAKTCSNLTSKEEILCEHQNSFLINASVNTTSFKEVDGNALEENPKYIEFLYEPQPSYPINSCAKKISLKNIAAAILEERSTVTVDDSECVELTTLIHEDPLLTLSIKTLKRIFLHPNDIIPQSTIARYQRSLKPIVDKDLSSHLTYMELQDHVLQYSIFWNRNIWTLAGSKLEPLPPIKIKYDFEVDQKLRLHVKKTHPFTVSIEEGQSLFIPFSSFSDEDYCYGHELVKLEGTSEHHVLDHELAFRNVKRDDSGIYELHPRHNGWTGTIQIILDVEFKPEYKFIHENNAQISISEGSTRTIKFIVTANPPLTDDTKHEISHSNGEPATRRFMVSNNIIFLNDISPGDSGQYHISCKGGNGLIGKEIFEIKVLCQCKPTASATEEVTRELQFLNNNRTVLMTAMTFNMIWLAGEMNKTGLLTDYDHLDVTKAKSLLNDIDKASIMMESLRKKVALDCKRLNTFMDILKAKIVYSDIIATFEGFIAPVYEFIGENSSLISVPEGSTKEIEFSVTPPLPDNIKHELTCLSDGVEVPTTKRFTVTGNTVILKDVTSEDNGLYQITCKDGNKQIEKKIFKLRILCKPEYTLSCTSIEVPEGSNEVIMFSVSSDPPLPDDTMHNLCLVTEQDVQASVPETITISQNTITMSNVRCEDSGTYQISCTNGGGIIGKETFTLAVSQDTQKYQELESYLGKIPENLRSRVHDIITSDEHLQRVANKMFGWYQVFDLFGLQSDPNDIQQQYKDDPPKQRFTILTLWRESCTSPTYNALLHICIQGNFTDSANELVQILCECDTQTQ